MLTKRVKSKDVTIEQINTDIPRTFPTNIFFRGKDPKSLEQPLFNVLLAFANHNPRIGKDTFAHLTQAIFHIFKNYFYTQRGRNWGDKMFNFTFLKGGLRYQHKIFTSC